MKLLRKTLIKQYKFSIVVAIIITILSLVNNSQLPSVGFFGIKNFDKIIHIMMYMSLSYVFFIEQNLKKYKEQRSYKVPNWMVLLLLIFMGGLIEIIQPHISNRSCDLYDFISNTIGAFLGYILYHSTKKFLQL